MCNARPPVAAFLALWFTAIWAGAGCRRAPAPETTDQAAERRRVHVERETWNACYLQGAKVGYERTTFGSIERDGRRLIHIEGLVHLNVKRFEQTTQTEMRLTSVETPEGQLLEFASRVDAGTTPLGIRGRVVGDRLEVQTTSHGKTTTTSARWSREYGGYFATEQSLARRPMRPGERRQLMGLFAGMDQVAAIEMIARQFEPVKLLEGTYELLKIDATLRLPDGQTLDETVWADRTGEVWRRRSQAMNLEAFRVPKQVALDTSEAAAFDLGKDLSVPIGRAIASPHRTRRIRYRVRLEGGDPAGRLVSGYSQRVRSVDPHTAEVTVYAVRPGVAAGNLDAAEDRPSEDDLAANHLIQSDSAKIKAIAAETAADEQDPWRVALALERRTRALITKHDYSQAFASAAEVVENGVGDCTEHAVLLAALARARGIPARAAIGLVYFEPDGKPQFAYHMWVEVYLGEHWIPLDATLAQGGIGAAHLKLAHGSLKGASALSSFLPVAQVAGRLKIEVEEVE